MAMTEPPTPMFGRYLDPAQNDLPLAIRCVFSGIDAQGRERLFASFRGAKEGYLFELDVGRSFDGEEIPAYVVLNPVFGHGPSVQAQNGLLEVYGAGYGVAALSYSRASGFNTPDADIAQSFTLGSDDTLVTLTPKPFKGTVDFAIEGEAVTMRFDSSSASEGPHTLQFTNLFVDARGWNRGYPGS